MILYIIIFNIIFKEETYENFQNNSDTSHVDHGPRTDSGMRRRFGFH